MQSNLWPRPKNHFTNTVKVWVTIAVTRGYVLDYDLSYTLLNFVVVSEILIIKT